MAGLQGRVLGGYQLADQIGGGGIAEVYRGHPTLPGGREVVVKIIYPEFVQQPGFRPRFDQIVQAASRLSHPHILPLLASGEQNGYLYLVTPYVAAGTLRDWLHSGRRLGTQDVAPFFRQLCEATGYAHSQSIVHGNIKPSNIFLHEGRHVLLGDFGRLWDIGQIDMTHAGPGSEIVEYMAPEAIEGRGDQRSDIYSLGVVLFTSLAGRAPFTGATPFEVFTKHAQQPIPQLGEAAPALAAGAAQLDEVVQRAMAKAPEARYPSAPAMAQAIEASVRNAVAALLAFGGPAAAGFGLAAPGMIPSGFGSPAPASMGLGVGMFPAAAGMPFAAPGQGLPPSMAGAVSPDTLFAPLGGSLGLGQLEFPPLSPALRVDPDMESGRVGGELSPPPSAPSAPLMPPTHGMHDPTALPTTALPAQWGMPGGAPAPGVAALGQFDLPAVPTMRVPATGGVAPDATPSPMPTSDGLSGPAGGAGAESPVSGGFIVAGGKSQWPPASPQDVASAPGALDQAALSHFGPPPGVGPDRGERVRFGLDGPSAGLGLPGLQPESETHGDRTFSATKLGLPRLTTPELGDLPPSWRDLASGSLPVPDANGPNMSGFGEPDVPDRWGESEPRRWGAHAYEGGAPEDSNEYPAESAPWSTVGPAARPEWDSSASMASIGAVEAVGARAGGEGRSAWPRGGGRSGTPGFLRRRARTAAPVAEDDDEADEEADDPFALSSAWASARVDDRRGGRMRRVRAPRVRTGSGRMRPLLLFLVLLILVDGTLLVAVRPDLCPQNRCTVVRTTMQHYLSLLGIKSGLGPASPLSAAPAAAKLHAAVGGASSVEIALTNTTSKKYGWSASSQLSWISISPASGTLEAKASTKVIVTARPTLTTRPNTYTTTIAFATGDAVLDIPLSITVATAQLAVSPSALTFAQCGTAQTLTLTNSGDAPLTFTAKPLETALSLDVTSGTLNPGAKQQIAVTLSCDAQAGSSYVISIVSNGGSAAITAALA
jgi:hypothetical protein